MQIEAGRFRNNLREDRLCIKCNSSSIDKTHCFITCGKYDQQRKKILQLGLNKSKFPEFSALDNDQNFFLLKFGYSIIKDKEILNQNK